LVQAREFGSGVSAHHQVFVRTRYPVDRLVADVGAAAGTRMVPVRDSEVAFAGSVGYAAVEVELSHNFEDDAELDFTAYPVLVTVRDFDRDQARQQQLALAIAAALAGEGHELLVVFDLQRLIERRGP
jgi:hypothetical protein